MSGELCLRPVDGYSCMKPKGHPDGCDHTAWPWSVDTPDAKKARRADA